MVNGYFNPRPAGELRGCFVRYVAPLFPTYSRQGSIFVEENSALNGFFLPLQDIFRERKFPMAADGEGRASEEKSVEDLNCSRTVLNGYLIPMRKQRSNIGENLLERSFSPNPSPRTFAIAETGFFQGEKAAFGDYQRFLRKKSEQSALQKNSADLTWLKAHRYQGEMKRRLPDEERFTGR